MWAVVVAQLVEQSFPIQEVCTSNPVIGNILSINCVKVLLPLEKTKIKKKGAGYDPFKIDSLMY